MELGYGADTRTEAEGLSRLAEMCVKAACESKQSVQAWRKQVRTLERLPSHLAHPLFHRLLRSGLLNPPLLELFQYTMEAISLSGESSVDAEWTAYLRDFQCLRVLEAVNCRLMSNFAISQLKGLETLQELDLSRCLKISDEALPHLLSLTSLKKLGLAETRISSKGLASLSALKNLTTLDLGGLPVTDTVLFALMALSRLQKLDVWGSGVSDQGVVHLKGFPDLQHLNLAWTAVTMAPALPSLKHLNMANCTISSIAEDWEGSNGLLEILNLSCSTMLQPLSMLGGVWASNVSVIDLSSAIFKEYGVLGGMKNVQIMDLSGTMIGDLAMDTIAQVGGKLKHLDLSGCKVTSEGIAVLAGSVPKLQQLTLSGTLVDDAVFAYLQLMSALKTLDLSYTNIKGFAMEENGHAASKMSSFVAIEPLPFLRALNLRNTLISDKCCLGLSCLVELTHLHLKSELLSDYSLQCLSSLKKLAALSIEGAMLTDLGLLAFDLPPLLKELSLWDCWLLTKQGILRFCEVHRGLSVRHGHLQSVSELSKGSPWKVAKSKRNPNSKGRSPGKTESSAGSKAHPMDNLQSKESLAILPDERIKFSRSELLRIREEEHNSQPFRHSGLLSAMEELAGLFKADSFL